MNVPLAVAFAFSIAPSMMGATFNFSDGTFNDANWTLSLAFNSTTSSSYSANQVLDGGNLGPFRSTDLSFAQGYLVVSQLSNLAFFNPGALGAIDSINFSYDFLKIFPTGSTGAIYYSLAVYQNGTLYGLNPGEAPADQNWTTHTNLNLTALNFSNVIENPTQGSLQLYGSNHPDFSGDGGVIQFGYLTGNDALGSGNSTSGIDNWSVAVSTVPEPNSFLLMGFGVAVAVLKRNRNRA